MFVYTVNMHESSVAELVDVSEAIDLAAKVDLHALEGPELARVVESVQVLKAKLAALGAAAVGAWEGTGEYALDGHRSAKIALRHRRRLHGAVAHGEIALARSLRTMPVVAELLSAGKISECHARRLARAAHKPQFASAEELLCGHALVLSFADFDRAVSYWEDRVDDDDAHRRARRQDEGRSVHSSKTLGGMGRIDGSLDPIGFAAFDEALRRIEQELFDEDWRLAREEFGPSATADRLGRTPAQRRADALVEMAHRASTAPPDGKRPEPLVIIHADASTFEAAVQSLTSDDVEFPDERLCELDDGTVLTPTQMIEQAVRGHVRRIVFGSPGVILDYGRSQRLFTGALRQAIQVRDRQCTHDGCEIPGRQCEVDHVVEWQDGGHTDHRNGKCRCSFHHRRHKPGRR